MYLSRIILQRSFSTTSTAAMAMPKSNLAKLRKKTGYSLSMCKKALAENEDDLDKAHNWLKDQALSQGWAKANKLESRNTAQGLIGVCIKDNIGAMVELNCETDFVARNAQFHELLNEVSSVLLNTASKADNNDDVYIRHSSKEELSQLTNSKGNTLADIVALNIGQIGENIVLNRGVAFKTSNGISLKGVSHPTPSKQAAVQYGRYGCIMAYTKQKDSNSNDLITRQLCQHIIGTNPTKLGDLSTYQVLEQEAIIASENSNKDKENTDIEEEIPEQSNELIHQEFLLDASLKVGDVLLENGIDIKEFIRFEIGQQQD